MKNYLSMTKAEFVNHPERFSYPYGMATELWYIGDERYVLIYDVLNNKRTFISVKSIMANGGIPPFTSYDYKQAKELLPAL